MNCSCKKCVCKNTQDQRSDNKCGFLYGGAKCGNGHCCSQQGDCVSSDSNECTSIFYLDERTDHRCGPDFGNAICGQDRCCSQHGWCGTGDEYCDRSWEFKYDGDVTGDARKDHRCGPLYNNAACGDGRCCSKYGVCGVGDEYCDTKIENFSVKSDTSRFFQDRDWKFWVVLSIIIIILIIIIGIVIYLIYKIMRKTEIPITELDDSHISVDNTPMTQDNMMYNPKNDVNIAQQHQQAGIYQPFEHEPIPYEPLSDSSTDQLFTNSLQNSSTDQLFSGSLENSNNTNQLFSDNNTTDQLF